MSSLPTLDEHTGRLARAPEQRPPEGDDLRIGDLAKATGKTARALRLYEEMGLLSPGMRTAGGFRVYSAEAVDRVRWIAQLQDLGFTLNDIQEVVAATAEEGVPRDAMARVRTLFRDKLSDVSVQIERLMWLQRELQSALAYLESCHRCPLESALAAPCIACSEHGSERAPPLVKGLTETVAEAKEPVAAHELSTSSGRHR